MRTALWRIAVLGFPACFFVLPLILWLIAEGWDPTILTWISAPSVINAHCLGAIVGVTSVILAAPIALLASLTEKSRIGYLICFIVYAPLTLGMVARNYSWIGLFSEESFLRSVGFSAFQLQSWAYSINAVALVMAVIFLPWSFFIIREATRQISATQIQAAVVCGSSTTGVMRLLIMPVVLRSSALAFLLNYTSALGYFLTPRLVGGGNIILPGNDMLVLVDQGRYTEASNLGCAFFLTCIPGIALFLWLTVSQRQRFVEDLSGNAPFSQRITPLRRWIIGTLLFASPGLYFSILPVAYTFIWSLFGTEIPGRLSATPSLKHYADFVGKVDYVQSFLLTFSLALIASTAGIVILSIHAYGSRLKTTSTDFSSNIALMLPLIVPQVVLAMALIRFVAAFHLPVPLVELSAMSLFGLPIAYLILTAARPMLPQVQVLASRSQGGSGLFSILHVVWPALRRPLATAFLCVFFLSFDELVVASFIWHTTPDPLARKLFYELAYSSTPTAAVVSVLLIAIWTGIFCLVNAFNQFNKN